MKYEVMLCCWQWLAQVTNILAALSCNFCTRLSVIRAFLALSWPNHSMRAASRLACFGPLCFTLLLAELSEMFSHLSLLLKMPATVGRFKPSLFKSRCSQWCQFILRQVLIVSSQLADHFAISVRQLHSCIDSSHGSPDITTNLVGAAPTGCRYIGRRCCYKERVYSQNKPFSSGTKPKDKARFDGSGMRPCLCTTTTRSWTCSTGATIGASSSSTRSSILRIC